MAHTTTPAAPAALATSESVLLNLSLSPRAVGAAMIFLFGGSRTPTRRNTKFHFAKGKYYANWVAQGNTLSGKHLALAREIAKYNLDRLVQVANMAAAATPPVITPPPPVIEAEWMEGD